LEIKLLIGGNIMPGILSLNRLQSAKASNADYIFKVQRGRKSNNHAE
jgi:hypothetical protein